MLSTLLLLSLTLHETPAPGDVEHVRGRVEVVAEETLAEPGAVGLSIAVGLGREVVLAEAYGLAEVEHGVAADPDTMFRIGSVTKQFTAAAICRLQEKDRLVIDEDLNRYLPGFDTQGHFVTLRHLLTHTSGVPSYTEQGERWLEITPLELTHDELLELVAGLPFDFEPGVGFRYSNTGYYLLGMVIEAVSGRSYAEHLEEDLFRPLGLSRTRYDSNSDLIPNRAQGYRLVEDRLENDQPIGMSQPGAAGALISTAGDLVRWQIALVNGRVVPPEVYQEMTAPFFLETGEETEYGFGLTWDELDGRRRVQHGGGIFGFRASLQYLPAEELSVAVLANSDDVDAEEVATRIVREILAGN